MSVDNSSVVSATGEHMSTAYHDRVDNSSAESATEESMSTAHPDTVTDRVESPEQPTSRASQTTTVSANSSTEITGVTASANGKYRMLNVQK
jgi:hypothetical protein